MSKYSVGDFEVGVACFSVGDRFQSKWDKSATCTLIKIRNGGKKPYTIQWDNGRKVHCDESWLDGMKFLEEKGAIAKCNSHNLTSAQELAQDSALLGCNSDLTSLEPQRLTSTAQVSLNCDIQELTTMATCKDSPIPEHSDCDPSSSRSLMGETPLAQPLVEKTTPTHQEQLILSPLPHPALHFQKKAIAKEPTTSEIVSPQSLKLLASTNQNSQPLKTSPVCSPAPISQEMSAVTSGMFYSSFPSAGTMRTGLLSEAATVPLPSLESGYCWLPSPGALSSTGKGRPPGQTKQEGGLKDLGLLQKGEVLNPDILCQWYNLPLNWLDPSESRAATELLESNEQQQEIFSILESQRSPFAASSTSIPSADELECTQQLKVGEGLRPTIGQRIRILKTRTQNLSQWIGHETTVTGINGETISVAAGEGREKKYLTLKKGWYEVIPEKFLEETECHKQAVQKPKGRQRKGCLYKYLENKKLKNGTIASYPRVIGDRKPDNPTHWRWGFNWEEKIDGEWKGRSIGSVPVGAVPMIQSMQREGASLEEIIGFIKRAKRKVKAPISGELLATRERHFSREAKK